MPITIECLDRSRFKGEKDTLALFIWESERFDTEGWFDGRKERALEEIAQRENFKRKPAETLVQYPEKGEPVTRLVIVGLGKKKEAKIESFKDAVAAAVKASLSQGDTLWIDIPRWPEKLPAAHLMQGAAEAALLATYRYLKHKSGDEDKKEILKRVVLVVEKPEEVEGAKAGIKKGIVFAEAVHLIRDLVNEPPSRKRPVELAKIAKSLASKSTTIRIYSKAELQKLGMNAILGVNAGSVNDPVFIHGLYKPRGSTKKKIGLVGKGITFDSGGLNIKLDSNMLNMKMDMAGGATALACLKAAEKLEIPHEVHAFVPFTENMPGNNAYKPGDVIRAYNGKTIEILNTDAEGRVVLADALAFASKQNLDAVIDIATLTGAVMVALGDKITGLLSNSDKLAQELVQASKLAGEKIWQLPLAQEYKERIRGKVGDWANISTRGGRLEPGAILGGLFLEEFVNSPNWAHLDIAGTAWTDNELPTCPPGGTGAIARTILEYLTATN